MSATAALSSPSTVPMTFLARLARTPVAARISLVWLLVVAIVTYMRWTAMLAPMWLDDNDDMMRLIGIHDLLAGQSWFDMLQYRLDPPKGGDMHWSRLADLGLLIPMALSRLVMTDIWADRIAVIVYPSLILLAVLWLMVRTAQKFVGPQTLLPVIFITLTSSSMMMQMLPGRIDHHGLQILFMLLMLAQFLQGEGAWRGLVAGITMALSLGVGLETLPYVATAQVGLWWLWSRGSADAAFVRGTGIGMVLGCLSVMALTISPALWTAAHHDAFGRAHAAALIVGGIFWMVLGTLNIATTRQRMMIGVASGGVCAAALALLLPELIRAPYATLDPFLQSWFMDHVQEAASLDKYAGFALGSAVTDALYALIALVLALRLLITQSERTRRDRWAVLVAVLLVSCAVALVQVRAFSFVGAFAILPCALMITQARAMSARPLATACAWIFMSMTGSVMIGTTAQLVADKLSGHAAEPARENRQVSRADLLPLANLPRGKMLNPIDLGTRILGFTDHSILAAPYHRAQQGMKAALQAYMAPAAQAEKIARAAHVDYIIYSPALAETRIFSKAAPLGLLADLEKNRVPVWLEQIPLPKGNKLKLYRVKNRGKS